MAINHNRKKSQEERRRELKKFFGDFQINLDDEQLQELLDVYECPERFNRLKNKILLAGYAKKFGY